MAMSNAERQHPGRIRQMAPDRQKRWPRQIAASAPGSIEARHNGAARPDGVDTGACGPANPDSDYAAATGLYFRFGASVAQILDSNVSREKPHDEDDCRTS